MEKHSDKSATITVGVISALATVCAAIIGGVFLLMSNSLKATPALPTTAPAIPQTGNLGENTSVPWTPGQPHPQHPHVVASDTAGKWVPEDGYDWANPNDENDLSVVWSPGQANDEHPNVVAADTEGDWVPAPSYDWTNPDNDEDWSVVRVLANIEDVTVDYDVTENGQKGMRIHVKFTINELQDIRCYIGAYFFYASGEPLKALAGSGFSTSSGNVVVGTDFYPKYRSSTYEDYTLFVPYKALNMDTNVDSAKLKFNVQIYNWRDETFIAKSDDYFFTFSK